ncbi:MAG: VCBS repeat-containing protein, partial [Bacteroidota bacterium]
GSSRTPGSLWKQNESGVYDIYQKLDSIYEDSDALFFDYDSDGDKDLYVASGGSEFEEHAREYQDRLYRNEGKGVFTKTTDVLPVVLNSSSCVRSADVDQDGDIDLFVGSSILPRKYPSTPGHQLLINENGQYKEVKIESLDSVGMIKDVQWADVNNDGWSDLMIVGDWMPITLFINNVGKLENSNIDIVNTQNQAISTEGWWRTIETGDLDNDGDIDFIIGNHGTNNFINPSQNYPLYIYRKDFDQNGSVDPLIGGYYEVNGQLQLMPMHSRDDVTNQLVKLKSRFVTYEDFSKVRFEELLSIDKLEEETYKVKISESVVLKNMGNSLFQLTPLPQACQTAPINDILLRDFNNDKHLDALLIGNDLTSEVHYGRYDAFHGALLAGDGEGNFEYISPTKSGFYAPQQGSRVITLNDQSGQEHMIVGRNSEEILLFKKSANEN